jgi:hypothetical protein
MNGEVVAAMVGAVAVLATTVGLYMLPWIVALMRHKRNSAAIFMCNLFLGWTMIGWVVSLVWAFTHDPAVI